MLEYFAEMRKKNVGLSMWTLYYAESNFKNLSKEEGQGSGEGAY